MAKLIERINRDIAAIENTIANLASEFHNTYNRYLTALGQAMRQQLILASYHLCTQTYPEAFLSLSFSQRQKLQEAIKQLSDRAKQELASQLYPPAPGILNNLPTNDPDAVNALEPYFDPLPEEVMKLGDLEQISSEEFGSTGIPLVGSTGVSPVAYPQSSEENSSLQVTNPEDLVRWQEKLESAIALTLQKVSRDSNRLFQQTGILPKKLPEPVLEAAAKVEASAETIPGPPNLLNLVIETENDREAQSSTVTHLTTIHLRLSEIEFADPSLTALRHQIRNLSVKLSTTRREYQKKQREKAVAEAEGAWRASWFDE